MQKSLAAKEDPDVSKCKRCSNGNIGTVNCTCAIMCLCMYMMETKKQNKQTNKLYIRTRYYRIL